jgi:hypothetical protein
MIRLNRIISSDIRISGRYKKLPTVAAAIGTVDMSLLAILLFVGTMGLSLWATMRVRQVYGEFNQLPASAGLTGAEAAATILWQEGISHVEIVEHDEALGDHYDPARKRLVLSRDTFHGTSTAVLGGQTLMKPKSKLTKLVINPSKPTTAAFGQVSPTEWRIAGKIMTIIP